MQKSRFTTFEDLILQKLDDAVINWVIRKALDVILNVLKNPVYNALSVAHAKAMVAAYMHFFYLLGVALRAARFRGKSIIFGIDTAMIGIELSVRSEARALVHRESLLDRAKKKTLGQCVGLACDEVLLGRDLSHLSRSDKTLYPISSEPSLHTKCTGPHAN